MLARIRALILYISIGIFDFGSEKLPGLSRNGPQGPAYDVLHTERAYSMYRPSAFSIALPEEDWRDIRCILNEEE